ncbi:E1-like protein-activating enzyme G [Pseudogymnoascus sp. 24MN13]|nr:E1-like protein-activating enzyme G [Pseudogymnoascus sp. 24MN13]
MALQYAPFQSEIELPFYSALANLKIDHDRLDVSARQVLGLYGAPINLTSRTNCQMQILGNALSSSSVPAGLVRAEGIIRNVNTIEEFKNADKNAIINTAGKQIWDAIQDGTIYSLPSLLSSFTILSFADLKKYRFTTWSGFPALHSDPVWTQSAPIDRLGGRETTALVDEVGTWRYSVDPREHGFFLAKKVYNSDKPQADEDAETKPDERTSIDDDTGYNWKIGSLHAFETGFFRDVDAKDQFIAFADPSTYPQNPGWMLRNLLVLVRQRYKLDNVRILCFRDVQSKRHEARSIILNLSSTSSVGKDETTPPAVAKMPKVTGWERNSHGKLSSRLTDLSQYMDPRLLADQSVDLNLKLMKWRIAPNLNLTKISQTKCLLIGAGTLGSYVSRNLLGWGVRKITFVDNGTVSFSNPIRQPLFTYQDCLGGGGKKAELAAKALQDIYPGVDSTGHVISVPMLGHPVTDEAKAKRDFETLKKLIDEHDAIFLLMDTRESRWLPTLMGKATGKIVMNAALGFDTYVVMRHATTPTDGAQAALGCYFCNDVVAPADSVKDQTLDQQCTVTRPGIAAIASAQLVELLASILQHPLGGLAPAPKPVQPSGSGPVTYERDPPEHPLGIVPHQIRGVHASGQNMLISGQSYDCCSACSSKVVDAYEKDGWDFVKKALAERDYITELSGLAEVQRAAEAAGGDIDWDSEGGGEEEGEGELL